MSRTHLAAAAAAVLAASPVRADPPAGRIESEDGHFEILGRPLRAGDRIDLPEGHLIVEESGPEDDQVGSFGVVSADAPAAGTSAPALEAEAGGPADAPPAPGGVACRPERAAYLAELWRASGIEVKDPVALLEGLEGGANGPGTGFYWFALASDAFRPLAWSSDLRARADALARCVRGQGG
jgi:hypothetical protein